MITFPDISDRTANKISVCLNLATLHCQCQYENCGQNGCLGSSSEDLCSTFRSSYKVVKKIFH